MKNIILFLIICAFVIFSIVVGISKTPLSRTPDREQETGGGIIPAIGSIEILNGCGRGGAANEVADFLRSKGFDVKSTGNAETWNYPFTMVVSRTKEMAIAQKVSAALNTDKLIQIRTEEDQYNVSIFIGPDYGELIQ